MTVVRMWETRLDPDRIQAFWDAVRRSWGALEACEGYLGGEAFAAAGDEARAVVITRWRGEPPAGALTFEANLDSLSAGLGHGWSFVSVTIREHGGEPQ